MKRTSEEIMEAMDKLLDSWESAQDKFDRGEWSKKFGERFKPYEEKLKRANGDDFDLMNASYDEYHQDYSDITDDEYANALEDNIKKVIERLWPDASEEEKETAAEEIATEVKEGEAEPEVTETHIETEDKDGDGEISEDEVETHTLKSDENCKTVDASQPIEMNNKRADKMKDSWKGSPNTSGGRDGKCGISDEEAKEAPEESTDEDELSKFTKELEDYKESHKRK